MWAFRLFFFVIFFLGCVEGPGVNTKILLPQPSQRTSEISTTNQRRSWGGTRGGCRGLCAERLSGAGWVDGF